MPTWYVQVEDEVKPMEEERLRHRLRKGDYSGAERVRAEGEDTWRYLYEVPLFREEVPHAGDPLAGARERVKNSFLRHLLSFVAVVGAFTIATGFPDWSVWWGIGLFMHGANTVMRLNALRTLPALPQPSVTPAIEASAPPVPTSTAAPAAPARMMSPWRASVETALAAIEQRASGRSVDLPDLSALRQTADELDAGATELGAAISPQEQARLEIELSEAETGAKTSADPRTVEAFERTAAAIRDRQRQTEPLRDTLLRIQARQGALLHQIEALRLALTTAQLGGTGASDLSEELDELRSQERAAAEVDRELASARRRLAAATRAGG